MGLAASALDKPCLEGQTTWSHRTTSCFPQENAFTNEGRRMRYTLGAWNKLAKKWRSPLGTVRQNIEKAIMESPTLFVEEEE